MDTAAKRYSAIAPLMPWRAPPLPDGAVEQRDRQHVALLYGGILASEAVDTVVVSGTINFGLSSRTIGLAGAGRTSTFARGSRSTTIVGE
jgi:hypothetical protein